MIPCIAPKKQFLSYDKEIKEAIGRVLESGQYILGTEVEKFEKSFAEFVGTKYCVGVGSGTEAIFLSLKALDIGLGDEVITVSHTAMATVSAIEATGAKATFVDIEEGYFTIDVEKIENAITPQTKAIVAVHLYGHPCEMKALDAIAKKNNLYLIEDCAQAHGAKYEKKSVGSMGDLGCFSFFPTKNLGAIGDGGAVVTHSLELYNKLRMLRQYGWDDERNSHFLGYNSRLDEIQSAILNVKLKYLTQAIQKRKQVADYYNEWLKDTSFILPKVKENVSHAYHLFVIQTIHNRETFMDYLSSKNIHTMIHYKEPVHLQKRFTGRVILPVTEKVVDTIISLPMYPELTKEEVAYICEVLKSYEKDMGDCQYSIPRADKTLSSEEPYAEYHEKELASLSAINGCNLTTKNME